MIYGYSRVSTIGQKDNNSLKAQESELKNCGAEKIYTDVISGAKIERKGLNMLLEEIKEGDTLICTKLDRLSRNIIDGLEIIKQLNEKGVKVVINNIGTIDNTATGRLTLSIMLAFSEFERETIKERMLIGKQVSNNWGGRPRIGDNRVKYAMELLKTHSAKEVSQITGISTATLARRKREFENI